MIAFSSVAFFLGPILVGLGLMMLVPCFMAWETGSADLGAFLVSDALTVATALALTLPTRRHKPVLRIREMFLLTNLAWFSVCLFGALPFMLSQTVGGLTDAAFESISAVTTTGATVLTRLDDLPKDILLWRSTMQWIGGLGIIGLGAAILPYLRIGGMRLFRTESSDLSEKALPKTRRVLSRLLLVYLLLSAACASSYWAAGMDAFDAMNHAMTTVSTGGFSTHDKSFAFFESGRVEFVGILFMLLGAVPFMLYLPIVSGHPASLMRDGQVHSMLLIYFVAASLLAAWLVATGQMEGAPAFREAVFNVVSIATTTGFVSADYMQWGALAVMLFFFLTFVGGCSGSTSGGIKIFRFKIAFVMFRETILRLLHPNATFSRTMQGRPLNDDIVASVMAFALIFAVTVGISATLLAALGNDFATSFSAAATAAANVGPGIGSTIGPTDNFAALTNASKWVIGAVMILGRLEIFTVLIIFTPDFWRN